MSDLQQTTVTAANTVLDRLGQEVADLLKVYMREKYSICLEPDCLFAIEEIGIALQSLLGVQVAKSLMQEIQQEITDLSIQAAS